MKLSSGRKFHEGVISVTTASSVGTVAVTFPDTFTNKPAVLPIPPFGHEGTYVADAVTTTGFTVNVGNLTNTDIAQNDGVIFGNDITAPGESALNLRDATYTVGWIATEKL